MSLLYRCDYCGEVKEPGDVYGNGVFTDEPDKGRPMVWTEEVAEGERQLVLSILPHIVDTDQQVCGACVGRGLVAMLREVWPTWLEESVTGMAPGPMSTEDFANYPGPFYEGPPGEWRGELPMKFQRDEAREELGLPPWEDGAEVVSTVLQRTLSEEPTEEKNNGANPGQSGGGGEPDRHLRAVRAEQPVPDAGTSLPAPTHCPDCGCDLNGGCPHDGDRIWHCTNIIHHPR